MKKDKKHTEWHVSKAKKGVGDFTGMAIRQKVGKLRSVYPVDYDIMSDKQIGKPPKSLA
jgi:hypothetical protein